MGKQTHLNAATNRFGLNKKRSVGDLNMLITLASPHSVSDWEQFYYSNGLSKQDLDRLGSELFQRLQDTILPEVQSITEEDCRVFLTDLVINKTFEGRRARYNILRGQMLAQTGKDFLFLPDDAAAWPAGVQDWRSRTFEIDYFFRDDDRSLLIGIKVCPHSMALSTDPTVVRARQKIEQTHREWEEKGFGRLFILYYTGEKDHYAVANPEILAEIRDL